MNSFIQVGFNTEEEREEEKLIIKKKFATLVWIIFPHTNKSDQNFIMFVLLSMDFDSFSSLGLELPFLWT